MPTVFKVTFFLPSENVVQWSKIVLSEIKMWNQVFENKSVAVNLSDFAEFFFYFLEKSYSYEQVICHLFFVVI